MDDDGRGDASWLVSVVPVLLLTGAVLREREIGLFGVERRNRIM